MNEAKQKAKELVDKFPKRNTKFKVESFFQVSVDDFHDGEFLFLSAKKVNTKTDEKLLNEIESVDEYGWVISTWCYDCKYYYKIFVCEYKQRAWKNHYHIESKLASLNGCDGYSLNITIDEFIEWMEIEQKK
jgi:hypothetical protein